MAQDEVGSFLKAAEGAAVTRAVDTSFFEPSQDVNKPDDITVSTSGLKRLPTDQAPMTLVE
jgi:hypothetical protein